MTEPIAHVYRGEDRVLQLENEKLLEDFETNEKYRVERL